LVWFALFWVCGLTIPERNQSSLSLTPGKL
jgi:hypothetical protein